MLDIIGLAVGAVLTLLILSYLIGDNPLYRLTLHIFVGALTGYSFGIVFRDVLIDMAWVHLSEDELAVITPVVLGLLLVFKGFRKQAYIGNFSIAYLVGVGIAVALSGALLGTIVPQVRATGRALSPASMASYRLGLLDGLMILIGTVCTLMSFAFIKPKAGELLGVWGAITSVLAWFGRIFLIVAFGIAFAGALTASLSIFIGRVQYLIQVYYRLTGF